MSVYIKGMNLPIDCPYCPLAHWNFKNEFMGCEIAKKHFSTEELYADGRPEFCPLIHVPEHGRLIDADALMMHKGNCYDADGHLLHAVGTGNIMCAPTIIPAEENE